MMLVSRFVTRVHHRVSPASLRQHVRTLRHYPDRCRVVVTGMGVVTPLGVGMERVWKRLLAGDSGIVALTDPDFQKMPSRVAGIVPRGSGEGELDVSKSVSKQEGVHMSEETCVAMVAADEAIEQAGWYPTTEKQRCRTGVAVGTASSNIDVIVNMGCLLRDVGYRKVKPHSLPKTLKNLTPAYISMKHGFKGVNHCVSTACATGGHAIGDAAQFIRNDYADVMVCGSVDVSINPLTVAMFSRMTALSTKFNETPTRASRPFDRDRDGFVIGEGAGILVLEELSHALRRDATIIAEVIGYGLSADAYHITSPPEDGDGMYRSMRSAVNRAGLSPPMIGYINAHATSTPVGDNAETSAIMRLLGRHADKVAVSSSKSAIGHLLGASGTVEAAFAILACRDGWIPPTLNCDNPIKGSRLNYVPHSAIKWEGEKQRFALSNSFAFGGTNASLCVAQWIADAY